MKGCTYEDDSINQLVTFLRKNNTLGELFLGSLTETQLQMIKNVIYDSSNGWIGVMNSNHRCNISYQVGSEEHSLKFCNALETKDKAKYELLHYMNSIYQRKDSWWKTVDATSLLFPQLGYFIGNHCFKEGLNEFDDFNIFSLMFSLLVDCIRVNPDFIKFLEGI
jgi:hypothetical protein